MAEKILIEVNEVKIRRGDFLLDIPYWNMFEGQVVGLIGHNGAGKTTLLEAIAGLRTVNKGQISVFGKNPWTDPVYVRSNLGYMTDDMPIFSMRIDKLLRRVSGYYKNWDANFVEYLLDEFKLDPKKKVLELSKGDNTRIRLIMALAFRPKILILDEPATGLDLSGRQALFKLIIEATKDSCSGVIVSSHQLHDIEKIANHLLVLNKGQLIKSGSTNDLISAEQTLEDAMLMWEAK